MSEEGSDWFQPGTAGARDEVEAMFDRLDDNLSSASHSTDHAAEDNPPASGAAGETLEAELPGKEEHTAESGTE